MECMIALYVLHLLPWGQTTIEQSLAWRLEGTSATLFLVFSAFLSGMPA